MYAQTEIESITNKHSTHIFWYRADITCYQLYINAISVWIADLYGYTFTHTYIHTYTNIHTCMHACTHARMHAYIYTYIHTYIHTYRIVQNCGRGKLWQIECYSPTFYPTKFISIFVKRSTFR